MNNQSDQEKKDLIAVASKIINALAACFLFSVIFLTVLSQFNLIQAQNQTVESLTLIFFVIIAFLCLSGFVIRGPLLKKSLSSNKEIEISVLFKKLNIYFVVAFIVFEAIAILGLVNCMFGGSKSDSLVMGLISTGSMILAWPKKKDFEQLSRK